MEKRTARQEINKLRALFPAQISVEVEKYDDGFLADIKTFPNCFTEADSFSELIEMVNDSVRTHFEIPEKYLSYMPEYKPPISLAEHLDVFPKKGREDITLELHDGTKAAC